MSKHLSRRTLLGSSAVGAGALMFGSASASQAGGSKRLIKGDRLLLLGTAGGPRLESRRSGISTALVVDDFLYIIDSGAGTTRRIAEAGFSHTDIQERIAGMYVTHMHSDHVADLWSLLMVPWVRERVNLYGPGRAGTPIPVNPPDREAPPYYHPELPTPGLSDLVDKQFEAFAYDLNFRRYDQANPDLRESLVTHDIGLPRDDYEPDILIPDPTASATRPAPDMDPFVVHPRDARGVQVTATLVPHGPMFPALAYRFDTPTGSVVVSGDTAPSRNLIRLAKDVDYLVHEVIDAPSVRAMFPDQPETQHHVLTAHTDAVDVGKVAEDAGAGVVVLTHIFPAGANELKDNYWRRRVSQEFSGDVVVGADLMELPL